MRYGLVCAVGLLLTGCYSSHVEVGGPRPRDGGPPPFDGFAPHDSDVPPIDGFAPHDSAVPPFDSDVPPPDAHPPDAHPPDAGPIDAGPIDAGAPAPALRMSATTFMQVADTPVFDTVFNHALELWVRSRETGDADFMAKGDRAARHLFAGVRAGRVVMGWEVFPEAHHVTGPILVPGVWTHIALVAIAEMGGLHTAELYVNGILEDRATGVPDLVRSLNDVEIICGNADFDIDEIRVWRVARSGAQIRANMNGRIRGSIPGMVGYWRLDESGQFALDFTATGNLGILGRLTTPDPADPTWILDGPF